MNDLEQLVLLSKCIPPMPTPHYLRRSSLMKKLAKSKQAKVTILHSGAGYGKSSALAHYFADQSSSYAWYQMTEEDDDLLPFLRHFLHSIKRVYPTFGDDFQQWDHFSMFPKVEELNKLYTLFANEFYTIKEPFYMILDDFHVVQHVFQINYIVDKLIEYLPQNIHIIVATRVYPTWNCLRSLKMNGQLIECKEADFVFTEEEIQVLFEDSFELKLTPQDARTILAITEGWAMAILLMAMQNRNNKISFERLTNGSLQDFFAYLSDEIYERVGEEVQQSLLQYSIFQTFSLEMIQELFGEKEVIRLQELVTKHAFIQPLSDHSAYRFHSLVQQFLEDKWQQVNPRLCKALHRQAVDYFVRKGNMVEAVYHAFKTKDEDYIGELLVKHATYFIKLGQFDWLLERIKVLSWECRERYYQLYYIEGECQRFRAQYEKAKQAYELCLKEAVRQCDDLVVLRANAGLAHIYIDTIQPATAEKYLLNVLQRAKHVHIQIDELHMLQRLYAENLVNLGCAGDAEKWVQEMNLPSAILMQGNLDVRIFLRQGKLVQAKATIQNRLLQDPNLLDAHRETDVLLSLIYAMLGEGELAKEAASQGLLNSERKHAHFSNAVAFLRSGHAELLLNPWHLQDAVKFYQIAIHNMDKMQIVRAKAEAYMGLAIAKGRIGLVEEALMDIHQGLYETERVQDRWVSGLIYIAMTMIYVENNYFTEAQVAAEKALPLFKMAKDYHGEMILHFWLAKIAFERQDEFTFYKHFYAFASTLHQHSYYFYVVKQTLFGPRDLTAFYVLFQYAESLAQCDLELISQIKKKMSFEWDGKFSGSALQVQLFGPLTVLRHWKELNDRVWQRDKAKELFVFLYMHRHRFVSKEEIMHTLWPSDDEEAMKRDFKVAYNAMLKVLEPERTAREESFYVTRKQSMYRLIGEPFIQSDVDSFLYYMNKGFEEKNPILANEWLSKASYLYRGTLFEDKPQIEWIQTERNRLARNHIEVLERLAQVNTRLKNFDQVIRICEQILTIDVTWEEAYRLMMYSFYQLNNRALAVKCYEKCVEVLHTELKIEPMESTVEMYEMIIR